MIDFILDQCVMDRHTQIQDHPRAVVMVNYKIIYRLKESYTVGTQVLISFDDNSCHILSHEQTKLCYSVYSGTNYYIRRIKDQSKSCPYLPTRQSTVSGYILSQNDFNKVFISHEEKILLKLKRETDVCKCKNNWESNYSGLYIRMEADCYILPTSKFPPSSVNIESNANIKLDYLAFTQDNYTRSLYESLNYGIEKTLSHSVKNFFDLARRNPDVKLFEIERPLYGFIRGEAISTQGLIKDKILY